MTTGVQNIRQIFANAEEIDPPPPPPPPPDPFAFTEQELEEILTFRWQIVLRRVMADSSDEWLKGFCKSIARHGKRSTWRPTEKQVQIMRQLLHEIGTPSASDIEVIER